MFYPLSHFTNSFRVSLKKFQIFLVLFFFSQFSVGVGQVSPSCAGFSIRLAFDRSRMEGGVFLHRCEFLFMTIFVFGFQNNPLNCHYTPLYLLKSLSAKFAPTSSHRRVNRNFTPFSHQGAVGGKIRMANSATPPNSIR